MRRTVASAAVIAIVLLAVPGMALAARLWAVTAFPLTVTSGAPTTITISVTNLGTSSGGDDMGCIGLTTPAAFTVTDAAVVSVGGETSGTRWSAWTAVWSANSVAFRNPSNGLRLHGGETAVFRVIATASTVGVFTWNAMARSQSQVSGTTCKGTGNFTPDQALALTVVPPLVPTPTPTRTASPSPTPSPRPSETPSPSASAIPLPSSTPLGSLLPVPSLVLPSPLASLLPSGATPRASGSPSGSVPPGSPSATASASPPPDAPPGGGGAGGPPTGTGQGGLGVRTPAGSGPGISLGDLIPSLGGTQWMIPGAVLSVPGLLVLAWVALQLLAGAVWIPAARRVRGEVGRRRRRRIAA